MKEKISPVGSFVVGDDIATVEKLCTDNSMKIQQDLFLKCEYSSRQGKAEVLLSVAPVYNTKNYDFAFIAHGSLTCCVTIIMKLNSR